MTLRIVHLTSVHRRNDVRIFTKMCRGLARRGFETHLVVADGKGDTVVDGVSVWDAGMSQNRLLRIATAPLRVLRVAKRLKADLLHLHDPELLPVGLALTRRGSVVVFDSHEDVPLQLLSKHYIPRIFRGVLARSYGRIERLTCLRLDGVIAATPSIAAKFARLGIRAALVRNYPSLDEYHTRPMDADPNSMPAVCYVGGISRERGIDKIVQALPLTTCKARLLLAGPVSPRKYLTALENTHGWELVDFYGHVDRSRVPGVLKRASVGTVCFQPEPNHINAYPNKLFEYMAAGLPVIASDFPQWREIVCAAQCGLLVDPCSPAQIAHAIDRLVADPAHARQLGLNGRRAVEGSLNWAHEEQALVRLYEQLLNAKSRVA